MYIMYTLEYGVFTTQFFVRGSVLLEYKGELITAEEADLRTEKYRAQGLGAYIYFFSHQGKKMRCVSIIQYC